MTLIEKLRGKEGLQKRTKRIVLIGSNAGDDLYNLTRRLQVHLSEVGLKQVKIDPVRNITAIENAIEGVTIRGDLEPRAVVVLVGQEARQYDAGGGMTLNVDETGIMEEVRNLCDPNTLIGRYRKNPDGSYDFYPDGQKQNTTHLLPPTSD